MKGPDSQAAKGEGKSFSIRLWVKWLPGTQKILLVKGKVGQNLWSLGVFFSTHGHKRKDAFYGGFRF